ncbi:c-type cytochrome domain-containing protein [Singulisphaera sp. Ch08]|uniref:C-type cytochrome domain-containing protein n=1 Tax=Singulisphaera sp. Ch08 TaxID=3120278 RepID=A0AAU7C6N1_9BACT
MRHALCLVALLLLGADAPAPAPATTPIPVTVPTRTEPVSYANEVADILANKCVGCHSAALAESKLDIEEVAGMLKGGKHGPAIVPGKAEESLLFKMASHQVEPVMPPKDKKNNEPLTSAELGLLKLWLDAGAKDDSSEETAKPIELGTLPPGVQPIVAVDMTASGERVAAGRANVVQVYDAASGLEIASLGGHKDIIQSVQFSPDGKRLAAGSYQVVTLWNVPSGGLDKTLAGHTEPVKAVAVSADGKTAFSASPDKTVRVWNLADGKLSRQMNAPAPVLAIALSPDGKTLALGGQDNGISLLNAADGKLTATLKGHTGPVNRLAFTPDGARLASVSSDGSGRIWTLPPEADLQASKTPDDVKLADPIVLASHKGPVQALAVTPDGQLIITGGDDATVRLWNVADGKLAHTIEGQHSGLVLAVAVSPDGKTLLTGSADKNARLFDLPTGTLRTTLTGHNGPIQSVGFSPKGDRVVTAGGDGGLKVWDTADGRGVIAFGHSAPDNAAIQPILNAAFSAEGSLISASADKTLKTWTFEGSWSEMKPLTPHVFRVLSIDFSPDGKLLAAGGGEPSRSGEIKIWDVEKATLVRSLDSLHSDTVFGVRFSPDGTKLASGAADKFLKVTNLADGKELKSFEGHTHHVLAVDWKSDGEELVSGGADNVVKVWDFESGEQLLTLPPAGKQITAVRWVPGKTEVAGASGDNLVRFWNVTTSAEGTAKGQRRRRGGGGGVLRTFSGPSDYVFSVAVSKDGSRVAAGGADSVLYIWNGQNAQVIRKIEAPAQAPATKTASAKP